LLGERWGSHRGEGQSAVPTRRIKDMEMIDVAFFAMNGIFVIAVILVIGFCVKWRRKS
jgi:hypothetical protein